MNILLQRSSTPNKRPDPANMIPGEILMNYAVESPSLFFKASDDSLTVIAPPYVGTSPPNSTPAGSTGNCRGELWFDSNTTPYTLKVYDGANWVNSTGGNLTGISDSASSNTFAASLRITVPTGASNTGFGLSAGINLTTGTKNTLIGSTAGQFLVSNSNVTAIGDDAAKGIIGQTTGGNAVAVGLGSMTLATNLEGCTAVGVNTLNVNRGTNNTAVGYNSLKLNTTGTGNIAVGVGALSANTTGSNNIAIGLNAMSADVSVSDTIVVGQNSGTNFVNGSSGNIVFGINSSLSSGRTTPSINNVIFGGNSGTGLKDGNNNVLFGGECLKANSPAGAKTANNCVFLGSINSENIPDNLSNEIIIGHEGKVAIRINSVGALSMGPNDFGLPGAPLIQDGVDASYTTEGPTRWFNDGPQGTFVSDDGKLITVKYGLITKIQ